MGVFDYLASLGSAQLHPLAVIGVGSLILVIIVLFHGVGLHHIVPKFNERVDRLRMGRPRRVRASIAFGWTIFLFLVLHLAEIAFWTACVVLLGLVSDASSAFYFTATTYTTLGIESNILPLAWRNFCPIIAISGLFTFAWTGSSLVNVVRKYYELVESLKGEVEEEWRMRHEEWQQEKDLLQQTRDQVRQMREQEKQDAKGATLRHRWELHREEREKEKLLRGDAEAKAKQMMEEERRKEDDLGQKPSGGQSG